ncbi:DNA/RNA non-specific endonuclease [Mesorhizobium sp. B2-3-10]|uniref:DNA/RNA non-specific endonuclease n=1 Tax=Mesorhizobium sp. B2-3-10 TaxID=2589954 RepID=UPI00112BC6E4|nr:DNA/RNA non-specific endonuclease [Mesorhizobium sp. B2-3-10]TPL99400.1 hypothetical protein FJ943_13000 [Mesorhizobium sp. B2-3-10]
MKIREVKEARWESGAPAISSRQSVAAVSKSARAQLAAADPAIVAIRNLSSEGQRPTRIEMEAMIEDFDLVDANFIPRCNLIMNCIARLQIDSERGREQATGFLVAPGLLMTNHHVLPNAEAAIGGLAQFGYWHDIAGGDNPTVTFAMEPDRFFVNDKELDFAVVALSPTATNGVALSERGYLKLSPGTGKTYEGKFVTIVQHPDGDYMQIALRENKVVTASQEEFVIRYTADTAHGSSGAPVFNDSFQIAALHSGGRIKRNEAGQFLLKSGEYVASVDDRDESDVVWEFNVGIRISRICAILPEMAAAQPGSWRPVVEAAMAGGDVLSAAIARKGNSSAPISDGREGKLVEEVTQKPAVSAAGSVSDGLGGLILPLALRVSLVGAPSDVAPVVTAPEKTTVKAEPLVDSTEAATFQIPVIFDNLPSRQGFKRKFLGKSAPMPKLTPQGEAIAAPLLDGGGTELKYNKFSIWMHAERRIALFTASNVDWRDRPKTVDEKPTDRDTLCGFPPDKRIYEQWVTDPRIAARHQLPDIFFTKDYYKPGSEAGAFDKGHIVRRDDVCWGDTFDDIQMANGDTFHVTNCSPQIGAFNQAPKGEDNWGDLEVLVQKQTGPDKDKEKVVIYAGPIFGAKDRWFNGRDDDGGIRVQIPRAYWKIVVNKQGSAAGAYGFVLKQDVIPFTEDEFKITPNWKGELERISAIQDAMRGWIDLSELIAIDKYDEAISNPDIK